MRKVVTIGVVVGLTVALGSQFCLHMANAQPENAYSGPQPKVLVGLARSAFVSLGFSEKYELVSAQGKHEVPAQSSISLGSGHGKLRLTLSSGTAVLYEGEVSSPVLIAPSCESGTAYFTVLNGGNSNPGLSGQEFRGSALIMEDNGSLVVANLLDVEKYLWSVVSCEVPCGWARDALKAQAVVSRTYAVHKGGLYNDANRSAATTVGDIKLWASEAHQVYRGKAHEDPRAVEACNETRGRILVYEGSPAAAYFHADAAGMTESPRFVWGGDIPYLPGVEEAPHESPHTGWEACFDIETLRGKLEGFLQGSGIDMITGREPGTSGRWFAVNIRSGNKDAILKGSEFRSLLELKSVWFSVFRRGGGRETLGHLNPGHEVYVDNGTGVQAIPLRQCKMLNSGRTHLAVNGAAVIAPGESGAVRFLFQGRGWGHGVGLSQWGAKAMADEGAGFEEILMHYYPATAIEIWW